MPCGRTRAWGRPSCVRLTPRLYMLPIHRKIGRGGWESVLWILTWLTLPHTRFDHLWRSQADGSPCDSQGLCRVQDACIRSKTHEAEVEERTHGLILTRCGYSATIPDCTRFWSRITTHTLSLVPPDSSAEQGPCRAPTNVHEKRARGAQSSTTIPKLVPELIWCICQPPVAS